MKIVYAGKEKFKTNNCKHKGSKRVIKEWTDEPNLSGLFERVGVYCGRWRGRGSLE